ncbi:hypothetical protein MKX01_007296 [Papaver californicum]|nr:hypothetical protein MKX01_007296 [Papaver californicum]
MFSPLAKVSAKKRFLAFVTAVQNTKTTMTEDIDKTTTAANIESGTAKDTENKADDSTESKADDSTENTAGEDIENTTSGNVENRGSENNGSRPVESIEKINEAEGLHIVPFPSSGTKPKRPYVGMIFSSIREAEVSYQDYGRENGFIMRRRSTYKAQRGRRVTRVLFTCSCEGLHKKKCSVDDEGKPKKNRSTMRTNCKAMMRIIWDKDSDDWVVNDFTDDHNHVMVTPTKRVLMGSNKYMPHSIMTKWMKDANRDEAVLPNEFLMHDRLVGSEAMRISHLCRRSTQLAYLAGRSEEGYKVVMDILDQAFEKVKQLDTTVSEKAEKPSDEICTTKADATILSPISQEKGKKRVRRGKDKATEVTSETYQSRSGMEISEGNKRPRVCKTCSGQGHDTRNCKSKEVDTVDKDLCRKEADVDDVLLLPGGEKYLTFQVEEFQKTDLAEERIDN